MVAKIEMVIGRDRSADEIRDRDLSVQRIGTKDEDACVDGMLAGLRGIEGLYCSAGWKRGAPAAGVPRSPLTLTWHDRKMQYHAIDRNGDNGGIGWKADPSYSTLLYSSSKSSEFAR